MLTKNFTNKRPRICVEVGICFSLVEAQRGRDIELHLDRVSDYPYFLKCSDFQDNSSKWNVFGALWYEIRIEENYSVCLSSLRHMYNLQIEGC
jgi:hypothetical protein